MINVTNAFILSGIRVLCVVNIEFILFSTRAFDEFSLLYVIAENNFWFPSISWMPKPNTTSKWFYQTVFQFLVSITNTSFSIFFQWFVNIWVSPDIRSRYLFCITLSSTILSILSKATSYILQFFSVSFLRSDQQSFFKYNSCSKSDDNSLLLPQHLLIQLQQLFSRLGAP